MKVINLISIEDLDKFIEFASSKGEGKIKILEKMAIKDHYYTQKTRGQIYFNEKISERIIKFASGFNFYFSIKEK